METTPKEIQDRRRYARVPSRLNEEEVAAIRKIKEEEPDVSIQDLAARFKVSVSHMRNIVNGLSWRWQGSPPKNNEKLEDEDRRRYARIPSRLTADDVILIRQLKEENPKLPARVLALRFKVSATHIYDIWKGNTWMRLRRISKNTTEQS